MQQRRSAQYKRLIRQLDELVRGKSPCLVSAMATMCALLHAKLSHHFWTGFYFVAGEDELHVGPYQGPLACQVLKGRGVCLHAVQTRSPVVVPDVASFPDHIACDPRSRSEIVIPCVKEDRVVAVLDIDAASAGQFTDADVVPLTRIVQLLDPLL